MGTSRQEMKLLPGKQTMSGSIDAHSDYDAHTDFDAPFDPDPHSLFSSQDASAFTAVCFRLCRLDKSLLLGADQGAAQLAGIQHLNLLLKYSLNTTFSLLSTFDLYLLLK